MVPRNSYYYYWAGGRGGLTRQEETKCDIFFRVSREEECFKHKKKTPRSISFELQVFSIFRHRGTLCVLLRVHYDIYLLIMISQPLLSTHQMDMI